MYTSVSIFHKVLNNSQLLKTSSNGLPLGQVRSVLLTAPSVERRSGCRSPVSSPPRTAPDWPFWQRRVVDGGPTTKCTRNQDKDGGS